MSQEQANRVSNKYDVMPCSEWKLQVKNRVVFMTLLKLCTLWKAVKQTDERAMHHIKKVFLYYHPVEYWTLRKTKKTFLKLRCRSASGLVFMCILLYDTRVFPLSFAHSKSLIVSCQWQLVTWYKYEFSIFTSRNKKSILILDIIKFWLTNLQLHGVGELFHFFAPGKSEKCRPRLVLLICWQSLVVKLVDTNYYAVAGWMNV